MTTINDTLRRMRSPHGSTEVDAMLAAYADEIERGIEGLRAVQGRVEAAFRAENVRLRHVNKTTERRIHGQRAVIRKLTEARKS